MTLILRCVQMDMAILDTGDIVRLDIQGYKPSGDWKMLGIVHCRRTRDVRTLSQVRRAFGGSTVMPESKPELLYKNGKPQWRVTFPKGKRVSNVG